MRRAALDALLADADLRALDAIAPAFDPLEVLATTRKERPHTQFLAWLLEPSTVRPGAAHGLGVAALDAVLRRALGAVEALAGTVTPAGPFAGFDAATVRVFREQPLADGVRARAPDLRVEGTDRGGRRWAVLVENKVDAAEGDGQLAAYAAWLRAQGSGVHTLLVYVTPDRRRPRASLGGVATACLAWSDVLGAAHEAVDVARRARPSVALDFAALTLDALRMRFGGHDAARALVARLHATHAREAARWASLTPDDPAWDDAHAAAPNALWHLRTLRPQAAGFARGWSARVAAAWNMGYPDAPALTAGAPSVRQPTLAAWHVAGVTDAWSVHLVATGAQETGHARPKLWLALFAPNATVAQTLAARDLDDAVAALPADVRAVIVEAAPTGADGGAWRWLRVGTVVDLPRGWALDDDAARVAAAAHGAFGALLAAVGVAGRDPARALYSTDRDDTLFRPTDLADRRALRAAADARTDRVLLAATQPTGHPAELAAAHDLGTAFSRFLGAPAITYDYAPAASLALLDRVDVAVLDGALFDDADAVNAVLRAAERGAAVLLLPSSATEAGIEALRAATAWVPVGAVTVRCSVPSRDVRPDEAGAARWLPRLRAVGGLAPPGAWESLVVAVGDRTVPLCAAWHAGTTTVLSWNADLGAVLTDRDAMVRWWGTMREARAVLRR